MSGSLQAGAAKRLNMARFSRAIRLESLGYQRLMKAKYTTQRELAQGVGISQPGLSKLLQRPDCPIPRTAPWSSTDSELMIAFRTWLEQDPNGNSHAGGLLGMLNARLKAERIQTLRFRREREAGQYVKREEIQHEMAAILHALKNTVMAISRTIRPPLPRELRGKVDRALRDGLRECAQAMEDAVRDMPS